MSDDLGAELARLLDQYDERQRADLARERKGRDADAAFIAAFAELRRRVIWPVFKVAGEMLAQRGHGVAIDDEEFEVGAESGVREAAISLSIAPAGAAAPLHEGEHGRALRIATRHYNKTVSISVGRKLDAGGLAGAKGAYPVGRVDQQLVEAEVLRLVAAVLGAG